MTPFNNELQVGQPAMIVGTFYTENSHMIGKIITIEEFFNQGEKPPEKYLKNIDVGLATAPMAVVSGLTGSDPRMIDNYTCFMVKYLMPLPPLGDVYADEMTDVLENLKVDA